MNKLQLILKGIVKENPTFVLVLGMCPTLGTTTSAANGFGMGVATMAVLILSNIVISLIKNFIPDKVRIPAFIVVIASFVTIVQMLMQAFVPALYATLGVFIPLIVVNCIILGRAEAFASKNNAFDSALDGLGIGLGFTLSLTVIGTIRELLGSGAVFGYSLGTADYMPVSYTHLDVYKRQLHDDVIPDSILTKEPSSELHPGQKDSDILPPYEVVDAILFRMIEEGQHREEIVNAGFDAEVVEKSHQMLMRNEKKRYQFPPVLRLSACAFGHERILPLTNKYGD